MPQACARQDGSADRLGQAAGKASALSVSLGRVAASWASPHTRYSRKEACRNGPNFRRQGPGIPAAAYVALSHHQSGTAPARITETHVDVLQHRALICRNRQTIAESVPIVANIGLTPVKFGHTRANRSNLIPNSFNLGPNPTSCRDLPPRHTQPTMAKFEPTSAEFSD